MRPRRIIALAAVLVAVIAGRGPISQVVTEVLSVQELSQSEGTYRLPAALSIDELLTRVAVVEGRSKVPGYDLQCGPTHACSFGQRWSDAVNVSGGRNGCDTRNDQLARDLHSLQFAPGTRECVVVEGLLDDPYTGTTLEFRKAAAQEVAIDHIYPRARAWDMGASQWSSGKRAEFANDPLNLAAVSGRANSSKGDRGLGEWEPPNRSHRCQYMARYLAVAVQYQLPVTSAEHRYATALASACSKDEPSAPGASSPESSPAP